MKISFLVTKFPSLSETFILNQITGLLDRGHEVDIMASRPGNDPKLHPDVKKYNLFDRTHYMEKPANRFLHVIKSITCILMYFPVKPLPVLRSLINLKHCNKTYVRWLIYVLPAFLKNGPYDILQCHFGTNGNAGVLLKKFGIIESKIVTMFHGYDIRLGIENGGNIYQELFKRGDLFLSISEYNYRYLIEFGLNKVKLLHHPVGVELDEFTPKRKRHTPANDLKSLKILSVARLVEAKGLEYGIKAFYQIFKKNIKPELKLTYTIVGCGEQERKLKDLINHLNLDVSVKLVGAMNRCEVRKELQNSHVFVLPSVAEALPVSLLEAQATGLPVIATSVGSVDQAMVDGESGFLVPPRDIGALAEKLQYLIEHPEICSDMGYAGRRYVEEYYDINKLNDRLVKIYKDT